MPILDLPNWAPTVGEVAARLLARTRQSNGSLAGTFNSSTTPTGDQVDQIIQQVVQLIRPRLGPVSDALADSARSLAALKIAATIEQSYFMEQVGSGMSPYPALVAEYLDSLKSWDEAAKGQQPGGVKVASLPVGTLYPAYGQWTY